MQKHLTGLAGLFTGFALLSATGAQAQVTTPPDNGADQKLFLTPAQGFVRDALKSRSLMQDRLNGPFLDEQDDLKAAPLELRSRFHIEESKKSGFADRIRVGDLVRHEIGGGTLSLRVNKGLGIRYKLKF